MESKDNYVTVEMFNAGIQEIKTEMNKRFDSLQAEIRINSVRLEGVHDLIDARFTMLGIIIGLVGLIIAVVSVFKKEKTERAEDLSPRNIRDIRALIREEFSLLNATRRGD